MKVAPRFYLDTSFYLHHLLGAEGSSAFYKKLGKEVSLCSSTLLLLESERNLVRMSREKVISSSEYEIAYDKLLEDREFLILKDLTDEICLTSMFPPVQTPRTGDLVHLRTAKWFMDAGGLQAFLTLDKHQKTCAKAMSLPVFDE